MAQSITLRPMLWSASAAIAIVLLGIAAGGALLPDRWTAAASFAQARRDHSELRAFLARMPKGGDLHVHLSGAVYAERLIAWAELDGLCVRDNDLAIVKPICNEKTTTTNKDGLCVRDDDRTVHKPSCNMRSDVKPVSEKPTSKPLSDVVRNQDAYDRLVNALSMRWFRPSDAVTSGHDQFFAAFGKFGEVTSQHFVDLMVDQLDHYAAEKVQYVEFMATFLDWDERDKLIAAIGSETEPDVMLAALRQKGLGEIVGAMAERLKKATAKIDSRLACGTREARAGCQVTYRYIAQVSRTAVFNSVFAQTAAAAALVRAAQSAPPQEPVSRVVALNFVSPEDYQIALRDYRKQMEAIGLLAKGVNVSLHAGELWLGLVPPDDLTFHIQDAVQTAGARRIGHGVSLAFETGMHDLLKKMRTRDVAVEINLTSNDTILGVRGKDHPLPTYLAAGVPVVLSTDDAGVARITLTNEYFRAARDYGLGYPALNAIARNSIEHSFLNEKDREDQRRKFDDDVTKFEAEIAAEVPWYRRILLLIKMAVN